MRLVSPERDVPSSHGIAGKIKRQLGAEKDIKGSSG